MMMLPSRAHEVASTQSESDVDVNHEVDVKNGYEDDVNCEEEEEEDGSQNHGNVGVTVQVGDSSTLLLLLCLLFFFFVCLFVSQLILTNQPSMAKVSFWLHAKKSQSKKAKDWIKD